MGERQEFKVLKLDKNNYVIWKWQFQNVARANGLGVLFEEGVVAPEKDGRGLALLGSALSDENILKIVNCNTFKQAWQTIEQCYQNKTSYEPQFLYRRLNSYKMQTASEVSSGLSEMRGIAAQLENLNEKVSENCLIGAILSALPESFNIFVTVWKNSEDKSVDSLVSKLMAEANEQIQRSTNEANALFVRARGSARRGAGRERQIRHKPQETSAATVRKRGTGSKIVPILKRLSCQETKKREKAEMCYKLKSLNDKRVTQWLVVFLDCVAYVERSPFYMHAISFIHMRLIKTVLSQLLNIIRVGRVSD